MDSHLDSFVSLALILLSHILHILQNIYLKAYWKSLSTIRVLIFVASTTTHSSWHEWIEPLTTSDRLKVAQCVLAL